MIYCKLCRHKLKVAEIKRGAVSCDNQAKCAERVAKQRQPRTQLRSTRAPFRPEAGKGLKRSKLRRVSKTNSKKHIDESFRRQYMRDNQTCEMIRLFPQHIRGWHLVPTSESGDGEVYRMDEPACDPNHIASVVMGTSRWDTSWNLVAVCRPVHVFFHRWTSDGLVLALRAKQLNLMLNYAALSKHCRVVFPSYLETLTLRFPFAAECREKLLQGVSA